MCPTTLMFSPRKDSFFYFAYGSNLLKKRIIINNPSAEFVGSGRLDNHALDFFRYSAKWGGAVATIVPTEDVCIWGAIWRVQNNDLNALDDQEGVNSQIYFPKTVDVFANDNAKVECRTYQLVVNPAARKYNEDLPTERRPSITYLEVLLRGAEECKLPKEYINLLRKIPNNGQTATPEMRNILNI